MPVLRRLGEGSSDRARFAVLGCGGAGCNTLRRLRPAENLVPVAVNDSLLSAMAGIEKRVLVDRDALRGLAEADPGVAKDAAAPMDKAIGAALQGAHAAVPLAGLGGQTGGWAAAVAARVARDHGVPSIAFVATPFSSEGTVRRKLAEEQNAALARSADAVVSFANDAILRLARNLPVARALGALGSIMVRPVEDLARVARGDDVPAVVEVCRSAPTWRYGAGEGRGRHAAFLAADEALASPWFQRPAEEGVAGIAVVTRSEALPTDEVGRELQKRFPRANLLVGMAVDPGLGDRVQVSLLAGWR